MVVLHILIGLHEMSEIYKDIMSLTTLYTCTAISLQHGSLLQDSFILDDIKMDPKHVKLVQKKMTLPIQLCLIVIFLYNLYILSKQPRKDYIEKITINGHFCFDTTVF